MRLTIVKRDNLVGIDGDFFTVDCSGLPDDFHALQWYGTWGEVERTGRPRPPNEEIKSLNPYQGIIDAWGAAKKHFEERLERAR